MLLVWLRLGTLVHLNCLLQNAVSHGHVDKCMYMHYKGKRHSVERDCSSLNTICKKHFNIFFIDNVRPYSDPEILFEILHRCCGRCFNSSITHLHNITTVTPDVVNSSDFVYPFLASSGAVKLFGHYFIPVVQAPSLFYITAKDQPVKSLYLYHVMTFNQ